MVPTQAQSFPELIPLPDGFWPEGVALGHGHQLYAGSLANGSIVRADLRTGEVEIAVPAQTGRIAVGLAFDRRSNALFVAGGPAGAAYVYDPTTGQELAVYPLGAGFINDVVVTRDAAYFTDSFQPVFYRIPLGPRGELAEPGAVEVILLGGEWVQAPGAFNANGIDSTADGRWLVIANSAAAELYRVDPQTGEATAIDLGEVLPNGDGVVLEGRTLYVVQSGLNQIAVIELDPGLVTGVVADVLTSPYFDIPTTAASFGRSLDAVNARFGTPPTPGTEYEIVQVFK